jgi:hypothetical protein
MKFLFAVLMLSTSLVSAQMLERLSQPGCDFVAAVAACTTDEVRGKVPAGFCRKSTLSVLDAQKQHLPTADFSMIEAVLDQEISRVTTTKAKDAQKVFNEFQDKCYAVSGDIKKLMNQTM